MKKKRVINIILTIAMIVSLIPVFGGVASASAPLDIPGSVNIALRPSAANNPYSVIIVSPRRFQGSDVNIINGTVPVTSAAGSHFTSWGRFGIFGTEESPYFVSLHWPEPVTITGTSVLWFVSTDGDTLLPLNAYIEYSNDILPGPALTQLTAGATFDPAKIAQAERVAEQLTWTRISPVGVEYNGNLSPWVPNTYWNNVEFEEPITARHIRLSVRADSEDGLSPGFGLTQWNVLGYLNPAQGDLQHMSAGMFADLISDVTLPTVGPNQSTITWSASTHAALTTDGVVTRPARGEPDATGTITATAVFEDYTFTRTFNFNVLGIPGADDADAANAALQAINLGNTADRTENFVFPVRTPRGVDIIWETEPPFSPYVWPDGTVMRPPLGDYDATVVVRATATFGEGSASREWTVTVPAFEAEVRPIVSAESPVINSPVGTAPRLPNNLEVTYSDGVSEMRRIQWSGHSAAEQYAQAARPVGDVYTMTGNVIGGGPGHGFQVTAHITVVAEPDPVPSNTPVARAIPLNRVVIDPDPDGQANRLTQNRAGAVTYVLNQDVTRYIHPFITAYRGWNPEGRTQTGSGQWITAGGARNHIGPITGYTTPTGWNQKLRGHGSGHYMTALALAYQSPVTESQRLQLIARMERMTRELREFQLMTMDVPHPTEDRNWEARDFLGDINLDGTPFLDAGGVARNGDWRVMNDSGLTVDWLLYAGDAVNGGPRTFGHGYLNAIPPHHIVGNESYKQYSDGGDGVWAPYYAHHKILAGLLDIHQVLDGDDTLVTVNGREVVLQDISDLALTMASDMGSWIDNRKEFRTQPGDRPPVGHPLRDTPGYRYTMWGMYIAGEYGGVNETLARLYKITGNPEHLRAAEAFWNDGYSSDTDFQPFFSALAANKDSLRTLHANTHIPAVTGALWTFRANNNPDYWNIAENFWHYNLGRYAWTIGNVKGNPANIEKYVGAYNQVSALMSHTGANETCAAYNLMKLAKYLNEHDPTNASYMDHYERLFVNQMIGSHIQGSTTNQNTYHYPVHLNVSKGRGGAGTMDATCCAGTGSENHIKYQDSIYFESVDGKTFFVGLYLPSTARWDAQDAVIRQECVFPSDRSVFTVTPGADTGEFEMKFRVPYWVTDEFDITLNGASILQTDYEGNRIIPRSTYVSTGVREWDAEDEVVVDMPFGFWVDYLPGKWQGNWLGSLMYGPLVMAATTATVIVEGVNRPSTSALNNNNLRHIVIDPFMRTGEGTDVTLNGRQTLGSGATGANALTRNVHTLNATVSGVDRLFFPHFYVASNYTTYFFIHVGDSWIEEKTTLFDLILDSRWNIESGLYTEESLAPLAGAVAAGLQVYAHPYSGLEEIVDAINAIAEAAKLLEFAVAADTAALLALIADAKALLADADLYTTDGVEDLQAAIAEAEAYVAAGEIANEGIMAEMNALFTAMGNLRFADAVDKSRLEALLLVANELENPPITGEEEILFEQREFQVFTRWSWNAFEPVRAEANDVLNNIGRNFGQSEVEDVFQRLTVTHGALLPWFMADEREELRAIIDEAIELAERIELFTPESQAALLALIEWGEDRYIYASLTFLEQFSAIADFREILANLVETGPLTLIRIDMNAITRVARNSTTPVGINVNPGACPEEAAAIVLSSSNQAMAVIGEDGRSVITQNRAGTVTLTASLPGTNLRHSVTLMIT